MAALLAVTALSGAAVRAQTPPPGKSVDPLDAEREKLRMKDVEAWKKLPVKSLDQVVDVKKTTQPLELPASVTDDEKAKFADLMKKAKDAGGGAGTGRALKQIEKMGHSALWLLVNELREIDYKDTDSAVWGMQLNNSLSTITMGINTGYVAIEPGEPMDPRKAQWNAMTVQQWQIGLRTQWPTKEKFEEYIKNRKAKKDAELDDPTGKGKGEPGKGDPAPKGK